MQRRSVAEDGSTLLVTDTSEVLFLKHAEHHGAEQYVAKLPPNWSHRRMNTPDIRSDRDQEGSGNWYGDSPTNGKGHRAAASAQTPFTSPSGECMQSPGGYIVVDREEVDSEEEDRDITNTAHFQLHSRGCFDKMIGHGEADRRNWVTNLVQLLLSRKQGPPVSRGYVTIHHTGPAEANRRTQTPFSDISQGPLDPLEAFQRALHEVPPADHYGPVTLPSVNENDSLSMEGGKFTQAQGLWPLSGPGGFLESPYERLRPAEEEDGGGMVGPGEGLRPYGGLTGDFKDDEEVLTSMLNNVHLIPEEDEGQRRDPQCPVGPFQGGEGTPAQPLPGLEAAKYSPGSPQLPGVNGISLKQEGFPYVPPPGSDPGQVIEDILAEVVRTKEDQALLESYLKSGLSTVLNFSSRQPSCDQLASPLPVEEETLQDGPWGCPDQGSKYRRGQQHVPGEGSKDVGPCGATLMAGGGRNWSWASQASPGPSQETPISRGSRRLGSENVSDMPSSESALQDIHRLVEDLEAELGLNKGGQHSRSLREDPRPGKLNKGLREQESGCGSRIASNINQHGSFHAAALSPLSGPSHGTDLTLISYPGAVPVTTGGLRVKRDSSQLAGDEAGLFPQDDTRNGVQAQAVGMKNDPLEGASAPGELVPVQRRISEGFAAADSNLSGSSWKSEGDVLGRVMHELRALQELTASANLGPREASALQQLFIADVLTRISASQPQFLSGQVGSLASSVKEGMWRSAGGGTVLESEPSSSKGEDELGPACACKEEENQVLPGSPASPPSDSDSFQSIPEEEEEEEEERGQEVGGQIEGTQQEGQGAEAPRVPVRQQMNEGLKPDLATGPVVSPGATPTQTAPVPFCSVPDEGPGVPTGGGSADPYWSALLPKLEALVKDMVERQEREQQVPEVALPPQGPDRTGGSQTSVSALPRVSKPPESHLPEVGYDCQQPMQPAPTPGPIRPARRSPPPPEKLPDKYQVLASLREDDVAGEPGPWSTLEERAKYDFSTGKLFNSYFDKPVEEESCVEGVEPGVGLDLTGALGYPQSKYTPGLPPEFAQLPPLSMPTASSPATCHSSNPWRLVADGLAPRVSQSRSGPSRRKCREPTSLKGHSSDLSQSLPKVEDPSGSEASRGSFRMGSSQLGPSPSDPYQGELRGTLTKQFSGEGWRRVPSNEALSSRRSPGSGSTTSGQMSRAVPGDGQSWAMRVPAQGGYQEWTQHKASSSMYASPVSCYTPYPGDAPSPATNGGGSGAHSSTRAGDMWGARDRSSPFLMVVGEKVQAFSGGDMPAVVQFMREVDSILGSCTEAQAAHRLILAGEVPYHWPHQKFLILRKASVTYQELMQLWSSMVDFAMPVTINCQDDIDTVTDLYSTSNQKMFGFIRDVEQLQPDLPMLHVMWDQQLLAKVRRAELRLLQQYLMRVLMEVQDFNAREVTAEDLPGWVKLMDNTILFAFKVHQAVGGFNSKCITLLDQLVPFWRSVRSAAGLDGTVKPSTGGWRR